MSARLVCYALVMIVVMLLANSAMAASIEGRWSGEQGTAVMTQDGNAIRSDATLPNGESVALVGVRIGNTVHYSYSRENGAFGTGTMTLSEDGKHLRSTYEEEGTGNAGQWQLTRDVDHQSAAGEVRVAGRWNTNLGQIIFGQSGDRVTGTLKLVDGHTATIDGQLQDREIEFTYRLDAGGGGNGKLTLSPEGTMLTGTYSRIVGSGTLKWILARADAMPTAASESEPGPAAEVDGSGR